MSYLRRSRRLAPSFDSGARSPAGVQGGACRIPRGLRTKVPAVATEVSSPTSTLNSPVKTITARLQATATLLADGRVLVTGGRANAFGGALAGAELYIPGGEP